MQFSLGTWFPSARSRFWCHASPQSCTKKSLALYTEGLDGDRRFIGLRRSGGNDIEEQRNTRCVHNRAITTIDLDTTARSWSRVRRTPLPGPMIKRMEPPNFVPIGSKAGFLGDDPRGR